MKLLFIALVTLLACACLSDCADVQERSHIVGGRTGTPLTASVGDTVLRVSSEKNLPNIAGKADISHSLWYTEAPDAISKDCTTQLR